MSLKIDMNVRVKLQNLSEKSGKIVSKMLNLRKLTFDDVSFS